MDLRKWILELLDKVNGWGVDVEQKKQELTEMMQVIFKNEKALAYIHSFVKVFVERYL